MKASWGFLLPAEHPGKQEGYSMVVLVFQGLYLQIITQEKKKTAQHSRDNSWEAAHSICLWRWSFQFLPSNSLCDCRFLIANPTARNLSLCRLTNLQCQSAPWDISISQSARSLLSQRLQQDLCSSSGALQSFWGSHDARNIEHRFPGSIPDVQLWYLHFWVFFKTSFSILIDAEPVIKWLCQ